MKRLFLIMGIVLSFLVEGYSQTLPSDANLVGHVVDKQTGTHLP